MYTRESTNEPVTVNSAQLIDHSAQFSLQPRERWPLARQLRKYTVCSLYTVLLLTWQLVWGGGIYNCQDEPLVCGMGNCIVYSAW